MNSKKCSIDKIFTFIKQKKFLKKFNYINIKIWIFFKKTIELKN